MQYVTWAELIYIQLLTPNASFLGHLAGILAGMLHVTILQRLPLLRSGPTAFTGQGQYANAPNADPHATVGIKLMSCLLTCSIALLYCPALLPCSIALLCCPTLLCSAVPCCALPLQVVYSLLSYPVQLHGPTTQKACKPCGSIAHTA